MTTLQNELTDSTSFLYYLLEIFNKDKKHFKEKIERSKDFHDGIVHLVQEDKVTKRDIMRLMATYRTTDLNFSEAYEKIKEQEIKKTLDKLNTT